MRALLLPTFFLYEVHCPVKNVHDAPVRRHKTPLDLPQFSGSMFTQVLMAIRKSNEKKHSAVVIHSCIGGSH